MRGCWQDRLVRLNASFAALNRYLEQPRVAVRIVEVLISIHTGLLAYTAYVHSPALNEPGHLTWLSNRFTGLSLSDMETGHKVFRRDLLQGIELREDRFGFEPELTSKLARRGCPFVELPVGYSPRSYADGKKIGVRDAVRAIWFIVRYRWRD